MADAPTEEIALQKHFVEFRSPGTLCSEESRAEVDAWDPAIALHLMGGVVERHGARPYGFRFTTIGRRADELNARQIAASPFYFVNCDILTAEEILAGTDPEFRIMRLNVEGNGWKRIARTRAGYLGHYHMADDDQAIECATLPGAKP